MRLLAITALTFATFLTTMLVGHTQANAVVCARGVYRAGCVGPHSAVPPVRLLVLSNSLSGKLVGRSAVSTSSQIAPMWNPSGAVSV